MDMNSVRLRTLLAAISCQILKRSIAIKQKRTKNTRRKIVGPMYANAQQPLLQKSILQTLKFRANANLQNISVRTETRLVDGVDGFLEQTKGEANEKQKK